MTRNVRMLNFAASAENTVTMLRIVQKTIRIKILPTKMIRSKIHFTVHIAILTVITNQILVLI